MVFFSFKANLPIFARYSKLTNLKTDKYGYTESMGR